jgi:chemotaxis protein MotB
VSHRRQVRHVRASHTDDWLITYVDTITLLLCLFVVLLALQAHKLRLAQNPMPATPVEQPVILVNSPAWKPPFRAMTRPTVVPVDNPSAGAEDRTTPLLGEEPSRPIAAPADVPVAERTITTEPAYLQSADPPAAAASILQPVPAPATLTDTAPQQASDSPLMPLPEIVARVKPEGAAHLEQKGDRITTLAFDSTAFFSRASATLHGSGKVILQEVVGNLKSEEYRDYMITIEGHTDDAPISTVQFPSNWELSTARAAAVVRFFVEQGVSAQRLRAAGYADTHPLLPNRDGSGIARPKNQAKNRRVVIGLEKIERR